MQKNRLVYLNGKFLPENEAAVSIFDRGFLYGDGVFETMRSYGGRIFEFQPHLRRLCRSAELVKIGLKHPIEQLSDICNQLLTENDAADAIVRLSITRGPATGGIGTTNVAKPTIAAFIRPPMPLPINAATDGVSAMICSVRKTPSCSLDARIKSMNYLNLILARSEAEAAGAFEAILLDQKECVTETSTANIFFVREGRLFTPGPESDILLGITRAVVLELAAGLHLEALEAAMPASDLQQFQECFLTNSAFELLPVTRIDGKPVGTGRPGPVYEMLHRAYRELVVKGNRW